MMQIQNQTQQISEEEFLLPLSEEEQVSIQGGILPLIAMVGVNVTARMVAGHVAGRVSATAAGRGIAGAYHQANKLAVKHPIPTAIGLGIAANRIDDAIPRNRPKPE